MTDELTLVRLARPDVDEYPDELLNLRRIELLALIKSSAPVETTPTAISPTGGNRTLALPSRRRRTTRRALPLAVVVALAGCAAAYAIAQHHDPHTTFGIECGGLGSIIPSASGNPLTDCAAYWPSTHGGTAAPSLSAYSTPTGAVAVLPTTQAPPPGWLALPAGFTQANGALWADQDLNDEARGLSARCLTRPDAVQATKNVMRADGLAGWTVNVRSPGAGAPAEKPCFGFFAVVEPENHRVELMPGDIQVDTTLRADLRLDRWLDTQLTTGPAARCVSPNGAVALARSEARRLGIPDNVLWITVADPSAAAPGAAPTPSCALATIQGSGGVAVNIRAVPGLPSAGSR